MSNVLAIAGSLRPDSFNRLLVGAAAELAPASMSIQVFDDLASIPMFVEDLETRTPDPVQRLRTAIWKADGILISTPEYNQSIPGGLKNALDWVSRSQEVLDGKSAAVIGATTGRWGTRLAQAAVRQVLHATGAQVYAGSAVYAAGAAGLFDADGRLIDVPTRDALTALLAGFDRWIYKTVASNHFLTTVTES
ncbi:MAG: NADPH-dependent FMN reductase [Kofleriaceae bacterium]